MARIKRPILDECSFTKNSIDDGRSHPNIEPGIDVTVRYHGLDVAVYVNAYIKGETDLFSGAITGFDYPPDRYDDLSIGDSILFHRKNVCSIP